MYAPPAVSIHQPQVPASAVVLRVLAILGMGLTFSAAVLALVGAEWLIAAITAAAFVPFLLMMYLVDRIWLAAEARRQARADAPPPPEA